MYRIEIKPGEENVFRTIEELATAIRNGLVTPRARIFHNASQKWLPIEFHPHYKKALQLPKTNSGENPAVVVSSTQATAQQPARVNEPAKPREPVKPIESARSTEVPKAPEVSKPHQPVTKTRELEIVYTPPPMRVAPAPAPVLEEVRVTKAAPVTPPPVAPPPAAPAPVAAAPVAPQPAPTPKVTTQERYSPVIELPPIDYPETTAVESLIPVASASKARGSAGRRHPLLLGTAAAVLIAGAYVAISGAMPAHEAAADAGPTADVVQAAPETVHQLAVAPLARSDSSIMRGVVTAAVPSSGPTFGGAPPAAPAPKRQIVSSIGATPPAPAPKDSVEAIEPPPVDVDLSVPSVPSGDSLAPVARTDSNAMGRILRAVSGKGGSAPRP